MKAELPQLVNKHIFQLRPCSVIGPIMNALPSIEHEPRNARLTTVNGGNTAFGAVVQVIIMKLLCYDERFDIRSLEIRQSE
jgi:hypothetical protein